MNEIMNFFKDVFMLSDASDNLKIGLSQFKNEKSVEKTDKKEDKISKEVKLSDLMRRSA